MTQGFSAIKDTVKEFVVSFFIPVLNDKIDETINFIKTFKKELTDFNESAVQSIEEVNVYNKKTSLIIEKKFTPGQSAGFNEEFPRFYEGLNDYLSAFEEMVKEVQPDERFIISGKENAFIKNSKRIKKAALKISRLPGRTANIPRKIFKKETKPPKNWHRFVPLKNLSIFYLRDKLSRSLFEIIEDTYLNISSAYSKIWELDERINKIFNEKPEQGVDDSIKETSYIQEIESIIKTLTELKSTLKDKSELKTNEIFIEYEDVYSKAGTIETPKGRFSPRKIKKANENLNSNYKEISKGWMNAFFTLFEDWRLNKELYILCGSSLEVYSLIKEESESKIINKIFPGLKSISVLLESIKNEINEFYGSSGELLSLLYRKRDKIFKQLSNEIIPAVSETILRQNIPELAGDIEINIEKLVQNLSTQRAIIKQNTYSRKVKTSEIDYISPKEIISFSSLAKFSKSIQHIKSNILKEIQKVQSSILDIDQISDFNLDTAISMFKSSERTGEDPLDIAVEGIDRAIGKTNEVEKILLSINNEIKDAVGSKVKDFNDDLIRLTKTENILEIKIGIAKDKALQRTTRLKEESITWFKNVIPVIKSSYKKGNKRYKEFYSSIRRQIGLSPRSAVISSEISDFLVDTQSAVSKLPVVYRRLFEIEALKDERFFEGREGELEKLNTAYEHWKKGGYAPVAIVGEKGSGATTLLNFFERGIEKKFNILRTEIYNAIYKEEELKSFLANLFKVQSAGGITELMDYLNNLPFKQIVVIENIQHLFLRKVNGFVCLKALFELISKTQKNIFWITSASLYSWEYLNKTLNIADYFGYVVRLKSLEDEQMIKVILKRHKISGYNLYFKPSKEEELSKSYKKISEEKRHDYLSKQFFSDLNKFAKSNISLALLFWLRSTREVSGDSITIGSLRDIDFSFLSSLETSKVFTLNALLIHDGLTAESFSTINNLPEAQSRLMLFVLLDDGVIIQKHGLYKINPLLYRQAVNLLQTKNIIH